jgi:hypothetical protein
MAKTNKEYLEGLEGQDQSFFFRRRFNGGFKLGFSFRRDFIGIYLEFPKRTYRFGYSTS